MIQKKITETMELRETFKKKVLRDTVFLNYLSELKFALEATGAERASSGVSSLCRQCGLSRTDCCGKGVELRYSEWLLLINLFLGVEIINKAPINDSCYFLSEGGCILKARHVFCVNFVCKKIKDSIPPERLKRLQELEGRELELIFRLEEYLKLVAPVTVSVAQRRVN